MATAYCTQADLETEVGGANVLLQLADFDGTGNINDAGVQARISGWLEDAAADIRAAAEVKHEPETLANLDADSKRKLANTNRVLAARIGYENGTRGLAMPEHLAERARRADEYLEQLATGRRRLGRAPNGTAAAINQPIGIVDYDVDATAISIAGFKRGFR